MKWRKETTVLALTMSAFFATMAGRLVISPLVPMLIDAFGVSKSDIGLALTAMWAAYAVMQFPGGLLASQYGERSVILAALMLTGVGSILVSQSTSYAVFFQFVVFLGAGAGLYFPVATMLLSNRFKSRGRALGFHIAGGDLAGLVAPVVGSAIAMVFGWRYAILLGAAVTLPVFLACTRWLRSSPVHSPQGEVIENETKPAGDDQARDAEQEEGNPEGVETLSRLMGVVLRPSVAYTIFLATVLSFTYQALVSFFPTFLIEYRDFSTGTAGLTFSALFVLLVLSMPAVGALSDTLGHDLVLAINHACLTVGVVALIVETASWVVPLAVTLIGIGMGWGGVIGARFMARLTPEEQASGYGLITTVYVLVASTGSVVTGTLADAGGWPLAYGFVAAIVLFGLIVIVGNRALGLGL